MLESQDTFAVCDLICFDLIVLPMSGTERYGCISSCGLGFKNLVNKTAPKGVFEIFRTLVHCEFAEEIQVPAFIPGETNLTCIDRRNQNGGKVNVGCI